jgi:hypothetical protein
MEAKELKYIIERTIEEYFLPNLEKYGFKWKKRSLCFQRQKGDFEQSILFFFSPSKYNDDSSIGHINVMIRFDSKDINEVASKLQDVTKKLEQIDTVVNVDIGLIVGSNAIGWRPSSTDNLKKIFKEDIMLLIINKIVPFLEERSKIQDLLNDFENKMKYIFWTSNGEVALRAIAMYSIIEKNEIAKKVAGDYYLHDEAYKKRYKNVLCHFGLY